MAAPNEVLIWEQCCRPFSLIKLLFRRRDEARRICRALYSLFSRLHFNLYYVITISLPKAINYFLSAVAFPSFYTPFAFKLFLLLHIYLAVLFYARFFSSPISFFLFFLSFFMYFNIFILLLRLSLSFFFALLSFLVF